ncbi:hypothetical protein PWT90_08937 [Aphanocladium album]|nr:hypothetical protein PWT90_08937 [Aphanocladium album]
MEALNAAGRRVSLLNNGRLRQTSSYSKAHFYATPPSVASSPTSPQLWCSGSYDSRISGTSDAVSPLTPVLHCNYTFSSSCSTFDGDEIPPAKRYPCRFRNSHGCEKTFITSGHASRHSKTHPAIAALARGHDQQRPLRLKIDGRDAAHAQSSLYL